MTNEHTADAHTSPVDVVTRLIETRRSIKPADFSDRRVEDALVWQMLSNANWAPTHGMTEPWRFFVFTDAARLTLGHLLADIYSRITPVDSQKPATAARLVSNAERSSHLIVIAMKRQVSEKIPEVEEIEAVACAVQNLHLTATAMGVAGYWSSGKSICSDQLRQHLGLSSDDRILGLFYVGYSRTDWPTGSRSPVEEKVVWSSDA
ncbi:MAG TPA: nitroreductase [Planctomycetes bacterium]|nr:nitroreductase [Fuerstiella sp.]HIK92905.1 nitroreductase [Planctomycetota bacterium]